MNTILGNKKNLAIVGGGVIALIVALLYFGFRGIDFNLLQDEGNQLEADIMMWGVWDESGLMQEYEEAFNQKYPNVSITYRKQTIENYEQQLTDALAENRGPDIFAMHHTWLNKHKGKMQPVSENVMTEKAYRQRFLDVVEKDFISSEGEVYGFPLYTDSLALYYNRDMFDNARIVNPPETWRDFQDTTKKLTKIDSNGRITQAGATLGTADNINRAQDILAVLMEQNLAQRNRTMPKFNNKAGQRALAFYTDFANPRKTVYSWNKNQNYSVDAFAEGKAAMTVGYSYLVDRIKSKSPRLNFEVAELPQISPDKNVANYTNYWGYTVSSQANEREARASYLFLKFLTSKENSQKYFLETNRPTPRRDLIEKQSQDLQYGVFAKQLLNIETWDQPDNTEVDKILGTMIKAVNSNEARPEDAVENASFKVQALQKENN
jgi:multiple sugar transport system substrate-binding protein